MPELGDDATPAVRADPELIAAVPLARGALAEITPESTIGEPLGYEVEESGAVSLFFECRVPGYPGWHWTVTVGRAGDDAEPTVLEAELMPGDGALLAPDWVPWSDRLADYQAAQEAHAVPGAEGDDGDDDDEDEDDEDEDDEFDDSEDDRDVHDLHDDGDLDGVDIDSVDVGFDEETDIDTGLDLEAEEAAALAAPVDEDAADEDSADEDATDDDAPDSRRTSAAPRHRQVAEPEHSEDESDDDGADPGAPVADAERDADDHHDDEGEQPER